MQYMDKIRESILVICTELMVMFGDVNDVNQLEDWLDNNAKFRDLKDYITGANVEFDMDMKVKDLKAILSRIDEENMDVIIPLLDSDDPKFIHGFRHVRTAGILSNEYEPNLALCLSAPDDGMDMDSQLHYNGFETQCEKGLFQEEMYGL